MTDLARPLAQAAERLFAQQCGPEVVSAASSQWPEALWSAVEDLAPARLLVPEDEGGAGGDWVDACALLERAGEFNVPLPIAETVMGGWLLSRAGLSIGPGPLAFSFVPADLDAARRSGTVQLDEDAVPWAVHSAAAVLVGRNGADDGAWLLHLPRASFTPQPGRSASEDPRDRLVRTNLGLDEQGVSCVPLPGLGRLECQGRAALLRAAQIAGACRRVLALTLAHTSDRKQFGRTIGEFQVVQHQLAQLAEEAAAVRVAVHAAAKTLDPVWSLAAVAAAKIRAGEAAGLCTRIAHQLHGAIGVTAEHPLHQSTGRLLTWRDEYGAEAWWARELVQLMRHAESANAWSAIVAATTRSSVDVPSDAR